MGGWAILHLKNSTVFPLSKLKNAYFFLIWTKISFKKCIEISSIFPSEFLSYLLRFSQNHVRLLQIKRFWISFATYTITDRSQFSTSIVPMRISLFPEHWSGTLDFDTKENATIRYDTIRLKWKTGYDYITYCQWCTRVVRKLPTRILLRP